MGKTEVSGPRENTGTGYLDVGDNVHANVCNWLDVNCADSDNRWFVPGECEHGHRYAKVIVCGKEWCPVCGKLGSMAHNRRYVRWLNKIRQFKTMRYLVLTIPENIRYRYRTKGSLIDLGRKAQLMMIKQGFKRGLRRWHWFGDKSNKWNPHLNILVEGSYMKAGQLESIHKDWSSILGVDVVDLKIKYKRLPGDMVGSLHYVTRATFLDYNYDMEMALELRNFRNMVVWGRDWKQEYKWDLDHLERLNPTGEKIDVQSIEKLIEHQCPICGSHLTWGDALPFGLLNLTDHIELGAGYYAVLDRPPPSHLDIETEKHLQNLEFVKYIKVKYGAVEVKDGD